MYTEVNLIGLVRLTYLIPAGDEHNRRVTMSIGEKIRQARKEKGIGQEALAEQLGLSVQAVSKWECNLSCPDIALLPRIADYLEVTLDHLLRDEQKEMHTSISAQLDLPDDDTLRIVQCVGRKVVSRNEWKGLKQDEKIPLYFDEKWDAGDRKPEIKLEIWGSADIEGSVSGNVNAGSVVNCGDVGNDANAGNVVNCGDVGNDANAGNVVNSGDVGNNVSAGTSVNCGDVNGNVSCEGEIHCRAIRGDVKGGTVYMDN